MKLKITASVFFAVLLVVSSGCIGGFDFERVAETSPQIQSFMDEHPNAEFRIIHLTEEQSAAMIDEIREQCGEQMVAKEYYKVTIDDEESGLMLIAYIDAKTEQLEGAYIKGAESTPTPTPTPTVSPTAPQASIRGTVVQSGGYNLVKLVHQGGDTLTVDSAHVRILVNGEAVTNDAASNQQLSTGQYAYIWNDGTTNHFDVTMGTPGADLPAAGSSTNIQIIDVASQQSIADLTVRG